MASLLTKPLNLVASNIKRLLAMDNVRFKSSGKDCELIAVTPRPCDQKKKIKEKPAKPIFKSMWDNPECCKPDPCKDVCPRYDQLYYRPSNKSRRVYTRTWVECPLKRIVIKKTCLVENIVPPPVHRNPRPKTACNPKFDQSDEVNCPTAQLGGKCPYVSLPCCRRARIPGNCRWYPGPAKCRKTKAPFPSYSECERDPPKPLHPCECKCHYISPNCRAWAHEIRMKKPVKSKKAEC